MLKVVGAVGPFPTAAIFIVSDTVIGSANALPFTAAEAAGSFLLSFLAGFSILGAG